MPDDKKLALSRRQLLGGLGAVGAASAGAGLGTTALFSDTESFNNNSITAGELDLVVDFDETYPSEVSGTSPNSGTLNGDISTNSNSGIAPSGTFSLSDVKPGDSGMIDFTFRINGNPGYVWFFGNLTGADENGVTEPEGDASAEQSGVVELLDAMEVTVTAGDGSNSEQIFSGTLRNALARMVAAPNLGVWGFPLDGDLSSGYNEKRNATGSPTTAGSFLRRGVNGLTAFESGSSLDLVMTSADDPVSGSNRSGVAHATSMGTATNDYVTSVVNAGGLSVSDFDGPSRPPLQYDYYQGSNHGTSGNTNKAPDEVWLLVSDGGGNKHRLFRNWNDQTADSASGWRTRNVAEEIDNGSFNETQENWKKLGGSLSNPNDLTAEFPNGSIQRVGIGVGSTGPAFKQDIYFSNLQVGSSKQIPTKETEYVSGKREDFEAYDSNNSGPTTYDVRFAWGIPADVGNEIQGDSVTFDLGFYAEQSRNNDGSASI